MNSQVAVTLSAPKLLRPLHTGFSDFRDDFDNTLKNITALSAALTNRTNLVTSKLDSVRKLPEAAASAQAEIDQLLRKCKENDGLIGSLRLKALEANRTASASVIDAMETRISECEEFLTQLNGLADKGSSESDLMASRLEAQKSSLQNSIGSLTAQIEKTTISRIQRLNQAIDTSTQRTVALIEELQSTVSEGFDAVMLGESSPSEPSFLAELQQAADEAELAELIARMTDLEKRIRELNSDAEVQEDRDQDEPGADGLNEEVFTAVIDGVATQFFCRPDGTFHN
jgi:ABC-type transporter Mla subunit MlaD